MIRCLKTLLVIGAAVLAMAAPGSALAEKRVALIVGNSTYQNVPQLPNPSKDANAIAKMFRDAGFDSVDVQLNVGNLEFKRAIRKFEITADQADIAVVYYAGHGLEIAGTNYLIPVDARLASDRDADDEAILLERMVASVDGAKRLRLVILDACRDNPFVRTMRRERKTASRGMSAGLGKVEPTSTDTLIAYAAKAGSTADDGIGENSPFTTAVLKNLAVPGLDVRLAFGRVRDEVLKATGNRQEPFVYGSLGGNNIALVPAPAVAVEAPVADVKDVKADFDLVQRIGTVRAWEVFLGSHPTGFHADLARSEIEALKAKPQGGQANIILADLPAPPTPSDRGSSSKESIEWDKVKDSTDPSALQQFIKRFPDSPLSIYAQQRMELLKKSAQERQDQARIQRELEAEAKRQAAAAKKLEEDTRRAQKVDAEQKAKAAAAELAAAKKREDEERRAQAAEAEQRAKAEAAERKAAEAKQRADQAAREKSGAEAAAARAASDKEAKQAEGARKQAQALGAKEEACKSELSRLDEINAKGSQSGLTDLTAFAKTITCDRLKGVASATLERFKVEQAQHEATEPNSPELVRSAQAELIRLGCLTGNVDGKLNDSTVAALGRYMKTEGQPADKVAVTDALLYELTKHAGRACQIECKSGESLKGETCVAAEKPKPAKAIATRKNDDDDAPSRRKQAVRKPEREEPRRAKAAEAPRARQQAVARPSVASGGGGRSGGGGGAIIGIGF